jgi:hypothetical protein
MAQLRDELDAVRSKPPQDRGYAFEGFLKRALVVAALRAPAGATTLEIAYRAGDSPSKEKPPAERGAARGCYI